MGFVYLVLALSIVVAGVAAVVDARTGHIPNWLTFGAMGLAVIVHSSYGFSTAGWRGLPGALISVALGIIACSLVPVLLYRLNGMGGGDVKLLAALGGLCGPVIGLQTQFYSFIAIVLYAFARLAYHGKLLSTLANSLRLAVRPFLPAARRKPISSELMTSLRLGPAIFAGVVATVLAHVRVG
jgi:prepilin peptidase CpaA